MVGVGASKKDALARVSLVDYYGNVVFDAYIRPNEPITDFRTRWSGVMPRHMKNAISFKKVSSSYITFPGSVLC